MNAATAPTGALATRYARLLRAYPSAHRARHGEEMLGVLLAAAQPGQRRPGAAESASLLWGALRIRSRDALAGRFSPLWGDAMARLSVIIAVFLATVAVVALSQLATMWTRTGAAHALHMLRPGLPLFTLPSLLVVVCAVAGRRMLAMLAAVAPLALFGIVLGSGDITVLLVRPFETSGVALIFSLLLVQVLALAASPRGRIGRHTLTWWQYLMTVLTGLALTGVVMPAPLFGPPDPAALPRPLGQAAATVALAMIVVAAFALMVRSPVWRRAAAVLAVPACNIAARVIASGLSLERSEQQAQIHYLVGLDWPRWVLGVGVAAWCAPIALLVVMTFLAAVALGRRVRHRSAEVDGRRA